MKSGLVIPGTSVTVSSMDYLNAKTSAGSFNIKPVIMVDDGMRRYFLPKKLAVRAENEAQLAGFEKFIIEQKPNRGGFELGNIGNTKTKIALNEFGRKVIEVTTPKGPEPIPLGITEINPLYVKWEALQRVNWQFGESTTAIPADDLRKVISQAIDPTDQGDRLAVARFYLQTEQFHLAQRELVEIHRDFPAIAERVQGMLNEMMDVWASQLLRDLEIRQQAGQHQLAMEASEEMLRTLQAVGKVQPEVGQRIREIQALEKKLSQQIKDAQLLMGDLQSRIEDDATRDEVNRVRMIVDLSLDPEAVYKLEPFLNLSIDNSLTAEQKIALAFSGWLLGPSLANTDLKNTLRQWAARELILEYLRNTDPTQIGTLLNAIETAEGIGPSTLIPILENLPPVIPTPRLQVNQRQPQLLELKTFEQDSNRTSADYLAMVPNEYSHHHRYPLIVHLRPTTITPEKAMTWWSDQAPRKGYIVIAPEYLNEEDEYDYSLKLHDKIERCLRDALRRFHIDTDRIYLVGHGKGGNAAFDFGMSRPGLFAGVIPISGECKPHCKITSENDPNLSLYVVTGEKDRQLLQKNTVVLGQLMKFAKCDILYAEYKGRGVDDYYEEIHELFDWMELHRLDRNVTEISVDVIRPNNRRFYWYEVNQFENFMFQNDPINNPKGLRTTPVSAVLKQTEEDLTLYFGGRRPSQVTLWLTPEVFDLEKRITVRSSGGRITKELIAPDVRTMLEDFTNRADRNSIARAKIVFD